MVTVHQFMVSHRETPLFLCKTNNTEPVKFLYMEDWSRIAVIKSKAAFQPYKTGILHKGKERVICRGNEGKLNFLLFRRRKYR